jgi:hypothetical protein
MVATHSYQPAHTKKDELDQALAEMERENPDPPNSEAG